MLRKRLIAPVAASAVVAALIMGASLLASDHGARPSTAHVGEAGWDPITAISALSRVHLNSADVAVDAAGNTTAVWSQGERGVVKAARRPVGDDWRTPVTIGSGGNPQVGADSRGNVTVVWEGGRYWDRVTSARRPVGGGWSDPVTLSEQPGRYSEPAAMWPELAVSRGGAAVVSWWYGVNDEAVEPGRIEAVYRPVGGRWSARHVLARRVRDPARVAIDARGNVTAAFLDAERRVRAVRRVIGRGWLSPVRISADRRLRYGPYPLDVQVAVDARGDATALWGDTVNGVKAASRPQFHRWSAPTSLRAANGSLQDWWLGERLAMDDAGTALFVYTDKAGRIHARSKPLRRPWGAPQTILPAAGIGPFGGLSVVFNPRGDALLAWSDGDYPNGTSHASYRPHGGRWGSPQQFAGADYARTALYRNGNAVAVWSGRPCHSEDPCRAWARTMTAPN